MQSQQSHRKDEHVFLAEKYYHQSQAGFDAVRFIHTALPELAVSDVNLQPNLFGWLHPVYINAMTGGSAQTGKLNGQLAQIAQQQQLAIASGSQAIALKDSSVVETFTTLRKHNPEGFILANLGAGHTWADAKAAIAMLDANALEIHLNAAQELVMPEGDRDFHWLDDLATIVAQSPVPVIVKEVGFGMSRETLVALAEIGVQYVDVAGRGGTNFAQIENSRRPDKDFAYLASWGQTTAESLLEAASSPMTALATGGIQTPLDALIALRLGARSVGMSGQVLHWLIQDGLDATNTKLQAFMAQLTQLMTLVGANSLNALRDKSVVYAPELLSYAKQRQLALP
ncbi:type 2 isopentenyl-diphosphate Delta-isomerase [Lacticaseibacillus brantae]|uniref:Isopentenyl-diphosphate delta-isomerase n=1 Tax=Lacticaseibacillus brantae DSM 23927 TaxID=1423727 RepID=A0A0R2B0T2_9LACO|nr:type 2 isopentenyl-diphosphate Delta-isomerase [Lacticaseibacillus brantae]KRM72682.1 isopentenyl pyrophosphate isomerase [Lacticaseibacillus brantae DSM 23927]